MVPTKHYALAQTLWEIVPQVGAADFLLLTQNWRGLTEIDAILPRSRYLYGDAKAGGTFSGGRLIATLSAIDIGPLEGKPSALAQTVAGLFASADIKTSLRADMLHYLWIQYAITGALWAALIHAGSFDTILADHVHGGTRMPGSGQAARSCSIAISRSSALSNKFRAAEANLWVGDGLDVSS